MTASRCFTFLRGEEDLLSSTFSRREFFLRYDFVAFAFVTEPILCYGVCDTINELLRGEFVVCLHFKRKSDKEWSADDADRRIFREALFAGVRAMPNAR